MAGLKSPPKPEKRKVARPERDPDKTGYDGRFAANLRELRKKRFSSQADFQAALASKGLDVSVKAVSMWETGDRTPKIHDLPYLADALGCAIRTLLPPN